MKADRECHECCFKKAEGLLAQYEKSEQEREEILAHVRQVLTDADAEEGGEITAPALMAKMLGILNAEAGITDAYEEPKRRYNQILMQKEAGIRRQIQKSAEPFHAAMKYAVTGNYIDFGAMSDVDEEKLDELLKTSGDITLDEEETVNLGRELAKARALVYITDNAGEVVLDKVFIEVLKECYPKLHVTVLVRGCPTLNDATIEDAAYIGLTDVAAVIPNGTDIPGTPLDAISSDARQAIERADLCIAKGQGNFETLRGCGRNIYYLFLCKCELFVRKFGVKRFTPVLKNEKRIVQYT